MASFFGFWSFPLMHAFCARISSSIYHHVFLGSCGLWRFPRVSFILMTLIILRGTGHKFCITTLNLNLSDDCLMVRPGFWGLEWGEDHRGEVPFSHHSNRWTYHRLDLTMMIVTLSIWLRQRLPGFPQHNSLLMCFETLPTSSTKVS
jgi:hypothetical protein